jgi:hypothetical protein
MLGPAAHPSAKMRARQHEVLSNFLVMSYLLNE